MFRLFLIHRNSFLIILNGNRDLNVTKHMLELHMTPLRLYPFKPKPHQYPTNLPNLKTPRILQKLLYQLFFSTQTLVVTLYKNIATKSTQTQLIKDF